LPSSESPYWWGRCSCCMRGNCRSSSVEWTFAPGRTTGLKSNDRHAWSEAPKVGGIARDDGLLHPLSADDDMSVDDVESLSPSQQFAHGGGVHGVERNDVRMDVVSQPRIASLSRRTPHRLRERSRGNCDSQAEFRYAGDDPENTAVIPFEGDQRACVERKPGQAAFLRARFVGARWSNESTQARSLSVSGPRSLRGPRPATRASRPRPGLPRRRRV
jgi:hypothetical protein